MVVSEGFDSPQASGIIPYPPNIKIMDIRKPHSTESVSSSAVNSSANKFKAGVVKQASASVMIPPAVAAKLSHLSKVYGLPVDLGQFSLKDATPENIKATRKITEMFANQSKLLPEMMKLVAQLLKADIKLAEFHKNLTKASIKHQEAIDRETADIFLAMAGYGSKAGKLEHRVNTRNALIEKRNAAHEALYENSVFGNQSRVIDVEYQIAASNSKILSESKTQRMEISAKRKEVAQKIYNSAFED